MPRKPRFFLSDVPVHIVQRGNNRQAIFFADEDYRAYLGWLNEAATRWACAIHAYVLMTNHVHLLLSPTDPKGVSGLMQYLGRRYVPYINHRYRRSGTLWEGRFKSSLIQSETYLLLCYRYIELNPVRAAMVVAPGDYPWSSYPHNAIGYEDASLTPHPEYLRLGATDAERQSAYRLLFAERLDPALLNRMRDCLQTGTPFGNDVFREEIERTLGKSVGFSIRGRPRKPPSEGDAENRTPDAQQLPLSGI
jgi:putative transposase